MAFRHDAASFSTEEESGLGEWLVTLFREDEHFERDVTTGLSAADVEGLEDEAKRMQDVVLKQAYQDLQAHLRRSHELVDSEICIVSAIDPATQNKAGERQVVMCSCTKSATEAGTFDLDLIRASVSRSFDIPKIFLLWVTILLGTGGASLVWPPMASAGVISLGAAGAAAYSQRSSHPTAARVAQVVEKGRNEYDTFTAHVRS
jgi:hypothetical protein